MEILNRSESHYHAAFYSLATNDLEGTKKFLSKAGISKNIIDSTDSVRIEIELDLAKTVFDAKHLPSDDLPKKVPDLVFFY